MYYRATVSDMCPTVVPLIAFVVLVNVLLDFLLFNMNI